MILSTAAVCTMAILVAPLAAGDCGMYEMIESLNPGTEENFLYGVDGVAPDDVWAVGGAVMHWNGETWEIVETFPEVTGPTLAGLDAAGPCDLWAGGRQIDSSGQLRTLTVHLEPTGVPGDIDGDGSVGFSDLLILLAAWGPCDPPPSDCVADIDGDGTVGFGDLLIVLAAWG